MLPTKTQMSLRNHAVRSESSLSAWRICILGYPNVPNKDYVRNAQMRRLVEYSLGPHIRGYVRFPADLKRTGGWFKIDWSIH